MFSKLNFKEVTGERDNYDMILKALIAKPEDNVFKFVSEDCEFVVYILDSAQSAFIFDFWDDLERVCDSENLEIARVMTDLFDEERVHSISSTKGQLKFNMESAE